MNPYIKGLVDISVVAGKGVYSVGEDIVYGIERTAEGLGASGSVRTREIGFENEQIVKLIVNALQFALKENKGPLYSAIKIILIEYYQIFPEETLRIIAKKVGAGGAFLTGRLVIGSYIARKVAMRILLRIIATEGFKTFAMRLGLSANAGKVHVGVAGITIVLMAQGVAQRASNGRKKLAKEYPVLSNKLRKAGNLDLLFFLIEGSLKKQLKAIREVRRAPKQFQDIIKEIYVH